MYLKIGDTDVSGYIDEESYTCRRESVYSDGYTNIYGEQVRTRSGERIEIEADLTDVDDTAARAVAAELAGGSAEVVFMSPTRTTAALQSDGTEMSIERDRDGLVWRIRLRMSGYVRDGL